MFMKASFETTLASLLAVCVLVSAGQPALAVTLTNRDAKPHLIEVQFKSSRRAHELAPGKSLSGFCPEGCIVRLNESAEHDFELEGTERVSIEGGLIYYDGEEVTPQEKTNDERTAQ